MALFALLFNFTLEYSIRKVQDVRVIGWEIAGCIWLRIGTNGMLL
jgi:hypothetical protein